MILIVEDDPDLRGMLCDVLEAEGFPAVCAANGREALTSLQSLRDPADVCLVLLDLMMPVMSGHQFLEERKANPRLSDIPVVIMSAKWDEAGTHALPFVRKPVDLEVLMTIARQHCGAPPAAISAAG